MAANPRGVPDSLEQTDKPIFWTVSISRLADLFRDITLEYDDRATIEPIALGFEDAVRHIRERLQSERCDAVIAAGSNAAYLKGRLPVPVVIARASGYDVLQALAKARRADARVGIISYQEPLPELADFQAAFGLQVAQRTYATAEDAREAIAQMKADGVRAVVGAGLITDLAEEAGLHGVFVYSSASIRSAFDDALELARLTRLESERGRHRPRETARTQRHGMQDLRGDAASMVILRQTIDLYARSPASVLIEGETGSGKELAAQALHQQGPRARRPFVAVNCGALNESLLESELFGYEEGAFTGARRGGHAGLIEAAQHGTLFLDEIGEMPLPLQTRLLRVLEEREVVRVGATRAIAVDVRIISATHCALEQRMQTGAFRADLYYRLAVLRLRLPPLRERGADCLSLAAWHLTNALAALGLRAPPNLQAELGACESLLRNYAWPGNVRQLRNLMERVALFLSAQPLQALTPAFLLAVAPELDSPAASASTLTSTSTATGATTLLDASASQGVSTMTSMAEPNATGAAAVPHSLNATSTAAPARAIYGTVATPETAAQVIARHGGNRSAAASELKISRTTLWRRLRKSCAADN